MGSVGSGVDDVLARSRVGLTRYDPAGMAAALAWGALVVDTRTGAQRAVRR